MNGQVFIRSFLFFLRDHTFHRPSLSKRARHQFGLFSTPSISLHIMHFIDRTLTYQPRKVIRVHSSYSEPATCFLTDNNTTESKNINNFVIRC